MTDTTTYLNLINKKIGIALEEPQYSSLDLHFRPRGFLESTLSHMAKPSSSTIRTQIENHVCTFQYGMRRYQQQFHIGNNFNQFSPFHVCRDQRASAKYVGATKRASENFSTDSQRVLVVYMSFFKFISRSSSQHKHLVGLELCGDSQSHHIGSGYALVSCQRHHETREHMVSVTLLLTLKCVALLPYVLFSMCRSPNLWSVLKLVYTASDRDRGVWEDDEISWAAYNFNFNEREPFPCFVPRV